MSSWRRQLLGGLSSSVTGNAQAFGFSITVTVSYGAISSAQGNPSYLELIGFALAAVTAFSLLNLLVAGLIKAGQSHSTAARTLLIGTATDFLAVGAAVGVAIAIGSTVSGWGAWVLGPFCAGLIYVAVQSIELAVGREETRDGGSDE